MHAHNSNLLGTRTGDVVQASWAAILAWNISIHRAWAAAMGDGGFQFGQPVELSRGMSKNEFATSHSELL